MLEPAESLLLGGLRERRVRAGGGPITLKPALCPQAYLTKVWWGQLSVDNGLWRVVLSMLFFPLLYTGLVSFRCRPGCRATGAWGQTSFPKCPLWGSSLLPPVPGWRGFTLGRGENCRRPVSTGGESHQGLRIFG